MSASLTLETARGDSGNLVLIATGEIDLSNIAAFSQALTDSTATAAGSGERLTVDLSAVEYLDSSAINALYHVADHIHLIANPVLMRSLTVSGLAELVAVESPQPKTAALDEH
jgi:anti-anti-sigma factor